MGNFDSRNTNKMRQRNSQRKLQERIARRAEAVRAERASKK